MSSTGRWRDNNSLLKEKLGQDYSDIPEVRSLEYSEPPRRNFLPGIRSIKGFVNALEKTGYNKFKIRATRCPVSLGDLKDSWIDLANYGWNWSRDWDNSMPGFNEVDIFYKK